MHINDLTFSDISTCTTSAKYIYLMAHACCVEHKGYWLEDLGLYEADEKYLSDGKWLTDIVIDAAQALLKKAYLYIGGLQSVVLAETLVISIQSGEFVQVLNVSGCHWIAVSNIGCKLGTVNIYDMYSLPHCSVR